MVPGDDGTAGRGAPRRRRLLVWGQGASRPFGRVKDSLVHWLITFPRCDMG